jgi:hypothetical protein
MSSTLTRPYRIRHTDDKALTARFVVCIPSSIPSDATADITRSTDGEEDQTLNPMMYRLFMNLPEKDSNEE